MGLLLIGLLACLLSPSSGSQVMNIRREMNEEPGEGAVVDNLVNLFRLTPGETQGRYFEQKGPEHLQMTHKTIRLEDDYIRVDRDKGVMTLKKRLDRDTLCAKSEVCILKVQVMMLPQRHFRLLNLDIIIKDINDNNPLFPLSPIILNITEATTVDDVVNLDQYQAEDLDSGNNSLLTYQLTSNRYFVLNHFYDEAGVSHLKLVVRKQLDYEVDSTLQFMLTATDHGFPPHSSQTKLIINIMDVNDIRPSFDRSSYVIFLSENSPPGAAVAIVQAKDFDTGMNGRVKYSIVEKDPQLQQVSNLLAIDSDSGEITLLKQISRSEYGLKFQVEATDLGNPPLSSRAWVTLEVEDTNNNAPSLHINLLQLNQNEKVFLSESTPIDTYVGYVIASDGDSGRNGEVVLNIETTSGLIEVKGQFSLNGEGMLLTKKLFDRETVNHYFIIITACDKGNPPRCSSLNVSVEILDENDNSPMFLQDSYDITLSEDHEIGTEIIRMNAFDNDSQNTPANRENKLHQVVSSSYGLVKYSISDEENSFSIDSTTGQVVLKRPLDRERCFSWEVVVSAKDLGEPTNQATCILRIKVTDVNDNAPIFINPGYDNTTIYASIKIKKPFINIKVIDYDNDTNSDVSTSIMTIDDVKTNDKHEGSLFQAFLFNQVSGELYLNRSYNRSTELLGKHYIRMQAKDHGTPPLSSEIGFFVEVTDWTILPDPILTPSDKSSIISISFNILIVIILFSVFFVFLILLVASLIVIKYRRKKQMNRSYDCEKAENDVETCQRQNSKLDHPPKDWISGNGSVKLGELETPSSVRSKHTSISKDFRTSLSASELSQPAYQVMAPKEIPLDLARSYVIRSSTSGNLMISNKMTSKERRDIEGKTTGPQLDMDSGRGDSEVESSCLQGGSDRKPSGVYERTHNQHDMGKHCTDECTLHGHSDSCWMPNVVQQNTTGLPLNTSSVPAYSKNHPLRMKRISNLSYCELGVRDNPRKSLTLAVTGDGSRHRPLFRSEPAYPYDIARLSRIGQIMGKGDSPYSSVFGSNSSSPAPTSGQVITNLDKEKTFSNGEAQSLLSKENYFSQIGSNGPVQLKKSFRNIDI